MESLHTEYTSILLNINIRQVSSIQVYKYHKKIDRDRCGYYQFSPVDPTSIRTKSSLTKQSETIHAKF